MAKKPRASGDEGGNWMDTYGDMVTLLLCFFVMLYSMSSLDSRKWEVFVRSIFPAQEDPDKVVVNGTIEEDGEEDPAGTPEIPETEAVDMDTLYLTIAQMMNEKGIEGVTLSRGEDYTFIVFQDKTFFDGDSSVLTEQGEMVLDVFGEAIAPADELLEQVNIMAHTAQGQPDRPNNPRTDRMLSAMRAAEVCVYIQTKDIIEPGKLVNTSYGQFRPIASNDTREGRAKNRRVEILLIDEGADIRSLNEYYEEYTSGENTNTVITDGALGGEHDGFTNVSPDEESVSSMVTPSGEPEEIPESETMEAPEEIPESETMEAPEEITSE